MDEYNMTFEEAQDYISKRGFDIPWNDCDVWVDKDRLTETVANVLKWADNNPADRWISVEDELPPNNGSGFSNEVLAYDSMYYRWMITSYDYRCNLWLMCERVTHWMPLPQPPKKGGEQ